MNTDTMLPVHKTGTKGSKSHVLARARKPTGELSPEQKEFVELMVANLPPVIARHEVHHFLGGLVSPLSIKNADLAGTGPEVAWRVGKKIAYKTESLVSWIVRSFGVERVQSINTI